MSRRRAPSLVLLVLLAMAASSACSSSTDTKETASPDSGAAQSDAGSLPDEEVSCQGDPRVNAYALPLTLSGTNGYSVTLGARAPNPSARGLNQWTLAVTDASGAPLVGAALVLATTMPDHGHSSPTPAAPPTDAQGSSTIPGLNFFMAGVWRIQVDVYPADSAASADPSDSVAFLFCVEG